MITPNMCKIPSINKVIKINAAFNKEAGKLKDFQDRFGNVNFNVVIGAILGGISSFASKPVINQLLAIFMPAIKEKDLDDYASVMMGLNNYLVYILDNNSQDIKLFEFNQWIPINEANFDSVYSLWYGYYGIMKVEFKAEKLRINKLLEYDIVTKALESFADMTKIMKSKSVSSNDIIKMQIDFLQYARQFNELRKLLYTLSLKPLPTLH